MKKLIIVVVMMMMATLWPHPASAQGCGLAGWIVGCDPELERQKLQYEADAKAAEAAGATYALEMSEETKRLQMEYDSAVAAARATAEAQARGQIALSERQILEINANTQLREAELNASIERDRIASGERQNLLAVASAEKLAAMDRTGNLALAPYQRDMALYWVLGIIVVCLAAGYVVNQWRKAPAGAAAPIQPIIYLTLPQSQAGTGQQITQQVAGYIGQPQESVVMRGGVGRRVWVEPSDGLKEKIAWMESEGIAYSWDGLERRLTVAGAGEGGGPLLLVDSGK
jgi:hypothetical protein